MNENQNVDIDREQDNGQIILLPTTKILGSFGLLMSSEKSSPVITQ